MPAGERYTERVALLVRVLPFLGDERDFALKVWSVTTAPSPRCSKSHRAFLAGLKRGEPDWDLTGVPQIRGLPAVRWKQANLDRMTPGHRGRAVERLKAILGLPHR